MRCQVTSGISPRFRGLSQSPGQVTHVLLTRSPLEYPRRGLSARLACVKHAASVRPEPGSNSPTKTSRKETPANSTPEHPKASQSTRQENPKRGQKLALAYKHPVEFSKNNHTPQQQQPPRGPTPPTYPADFGPQAAVIRLVRLRPGLPQDRQTCRSLGRVPIMRAGRPSASIDLAIVGLVRFPAGRSPYPVGSATAKSVPGGGPAVSRGQTEKYAVRTAASNRRGLFRVTCSNAGYRTSSTPATVRLPRRSTRKRPCSRASSVTFASTSDTRALLT
jgi:hypothetical protein